VVNGVSSKELLSLFEYTLRLALKLLSQCRMVCVDGKDMSRFQVFQLKVARSGQRMLHGVHDGKGHKVVASGSQGEALFEAGIEKIRDDKGHTAFFFVLG